MKRRAIAGTLVVFALTLIGCGERTVSPTHSEEPPKDFNIVFRHGVGAKNELNTFKDTYTRDMVFGPSHTIKFPLTLKEREEIYRKVREIKFFNYPDDFTPRQEGNRRISVYPLVSYYIQVQSNGQSKTLSWQDESGGKGRYDQMSLRIYELIHLIHQIIERKAAYQTLPEPRGGYL